MRAARMKTVEAVMRLVDDGVYPQEAMEKVSARVAGFQQGLMDDLRTAPAPVATVVEDEFDEDEDDDGEDSVNNAA